MYPSDPGRLRRLLNLLLVLACLSLVARIGQDRLTGWRLTLETAPGPPGPDAFEGHASETTSDALQLEPRATAGLRRARFEGFWWVETGGTHVLTLKGREASDVWLDGTIAFHETGGPRPREQVRVELDPGLHALRAEFQIQGPFPVFKLTLTTATGEPAGPAFPSRPSRGMRALLAVLAVSSRALPALLALLAASALSLTGVRWLDSSRVRWSLAALVVLYAGSLRLESVVRQYWGLDAPAWARQITAFATEWRPSVMKLAPEDRPYVGDPSSYLRYARAMEGFYDAHAREPLFVAATRAGLVLAGGADIGISLTSALFSTLMVLALYLLGASCFGHGVGLLAAFLLAIEPQAIGLAAQGWRDDAFAFFVLLAALAMARLQAQTSFANALGLGLAGGAACLTRITSLSFLVPALVYLWFGGEEADPGPRRRGVVLALLIACALVAPYLASCFIAFGDPLLAINTHTGFYRSRIGLPTGPAMSWSQYLLTAFGPSELVRKLAIGLTVYPFTNKWLSYVLWLPGLPTALRLSCVAGLALFASHRQGRLLLIVLLAALLPFAFTWDVTGGREWRLTLFAYPFYLLASAFAAARALRFLRGAREAEPPSPPS